METPRGCCCVHAPASALPAPLMFRAMMPSLARMVCPPSCRRRPGRSEEGTSGQSGASAQHGGMQAGRLVCVQASAKQSWPSDPASQWVGLHACSGAGPARPPSPRGAAPGRRPSGSGRSARRAGRGGAVRQGGFRGRACTMLGRVCRGACCLRASGLSVALATYLRALAKFGLIAMLGAAPPSPHPKGGTTVTLSPPWPGRGPAPPCPA